MQTSIARDLSSPRRVAIVGGAASALESSAIAGPVR
jgi:hypothetical protein